MFYICNYCIETTGGPLMRILLEHFCIYKTSYSGETKFAGSYRRNACTVEDFRTPWQNVDLEKMAGDHVICIHMG